METTQDPETIECKCCGSDVDFDSSYWLKKHGDVCQECYYDNLETCQLCGNDTIEEDELSEFILVKHELGRTGGRPPGIYKVRGRPFLLQPIVGSGSLTSYYVTFVARLPRPDHEYEISGYLCQRCAKPYETVMRAAYGNRPPGPFNDKDWKRERKHTRSVILRHSDIIRDLECDPEDSDWLDLKKLYDLPDLPTYHDWLFLEHQGVKVYRTSRGDNSWLTLRPEPEFRNTYKSTFLIFAPSGLPTYNHPSSEGWGYYERQREAVRPAVIAAIEQGILTQDGVLSPGGQVISCR